MRIGYFADGPWSYKDLKKTIGNTDLDIKFVSALYENPDLDWEEFYTDQKINVGDRLNGHNCYC